MAIVWAPLEISRKEFLAQRRKGAKFGPSAAGGLNFAPLHLCARWFFFNARSAIITSLMTQLNFTQGAPLTQDETGTIRVKGSRVTLDTIIHRFQFGDTVEEIQDCFPSLTLAQVKSVIAWYFDNQAGADEYLRKREAEAAELEREIRSKFDHAALKERLLKRREELRKS